VLLEEYLPVMAGELTAPVLSAPRPFGFHLRRHSAKRQSLQHQVPVHPGLHRPGLDLPGEQVNHRCQIQSTRIGVDMGDIGHPSLIWRTQLKLAWQSIRCHDGWAFKNASELSISNLLLSLPLWNSERHFLGLLIAELTPCLIQR
jgi:hypothetical protein